MNAGTTVRNYHRTGQARLNAIEVAALANEHEQRGKPVSVTQIARYFDVPHYVALYAVQWLCKYGYATNAHGKVTVIRIDDSARPYTVMLDTHGKLHRLHQLSASDRRFLERTGWETVYVPAVVSA